MYVKTKELAPIGGGVRLAHPLDPPMISIDLSRKFTQYVQTVTGSADVIVTQLLRYHMPLVYFVYNHLIVVIPGLMILLQLK